MENTLKINENLFGSAMQVFTFLKNKFVINKPKAFKKYEQEFNSSENDDNCKFILKATYAPEADLEYKILITFNDCNRRPVQISMISKDFSEKNLNDLFFDVMLRIFTD